MLYQGQGGVLHVSILVVQAETIERCRGIVPTECRCEWLSFVVCWYECYALYFEIYDVRGENLRGFFLMLW